MQKLVTIALVVALLPAGAMAEGTVNGAELGLSYSSFAEGSMRKLSNTALEGALEYGFAPAFAAQLDLAQHHYNASGDEGTAATLHAIGHVNAATALGGFVGHEWLDGNHFEHYGLEAKHDFGLMTVEGYTAKISDNAGDADLLGLEGRYAMSDALALGGRLETVDVKGGTDTTSLDATLAYALPSGVALNGSLGLTDGNRMDREVTLGLGIKTTLGGNGVTFGRRGLQTLIPGR